MILRALSLLCQVLRVPGEEELSVLLILGVLLELPGRLGVPRTVTNDLPTTDTTTDHD